MNLPGTPAAPARDEPARAAPPGASGAAAAAVAALAPLPPGRALEARELLALFHRSAPHYERIVRTMSLGLDGRYRREAVARAGIGRGMCVLDVGAGTGAVARAARDAVGPSGLVTAIDPSRAMLREARGGGVRRAACAIAEALPFRDESFDAVTMGYALRHVVDLVAAFREFRRVLRPGGIVLVLEQTPPATRLGRSIFRAYMRGFVPVLTRVVTRSRDAEELMAYYWRTIEDCVDAEAVLLALRRSGLESVGRHVEKGAFSEYRARRPPSLRAAIAPAPA
ncbi:MAG TPA: class I SAM-dependent methyltransferase [Burkholderiales bacterium]|nr:class I SAM-dependent methyltransferase [Burkholderiales bacterium]